MRILAASRAAEAAGARPRMGLTDARALVPALLAQPADLAADMMALAALAQWCGRYSPWVAIDPSGTAANEAALWLDVTGCTHLYGGEDRLLADLTSRLARLSYAVRAAIADTPGVAWAVARFAPAMAKRWVVVLPGGGGVALALLPAAALRLPPASVAGLAAVGLRTAGDLFATPRGPLLARFGAAVGERIDEALGARIEPISPDPPRPQRAARLAFAEPIATPADIAAATRRLLDQLGAILAQAQVGARRLALTLYHADGTCQRLAIGTSRATRDPLHLARLFAERIETIDPGFGIDAMMLAASMVEPLGATQIAAPGAEDQAPIGADDDTLGLLIDRLANRLGAESVVTLVARASHIPERAVVLAPALRPRPAPIAPRADTPPRPLRLLSPPEPVEAVAPVPDDAPVAFRWRRMLHRVARADGPERIAPEWWRWAAFAGAAAATEAEAWAAARLRDYYRVEDTAGARFWLFREGLYRADAPPAWYMHGLFG